MDFNCLGDTAEAKVLTYVFLGLAPGPAPSVSFVGTRSNENDRTPDVVPVEMVSAHLLDDDDDEDEDD
jgi:hypothetical protein